MQKVIQIIQLTSAVISLVVKAVEEIESAIPVAKAGAEKCQAVMVIVKSAIDTVADFSDDIKKTVVEKIVPNIVATLVSLKNAFGIFKKSE